MEQKSQKLIKTTIQKLISKISIIAVFAALIVVGISYAGLTFSITLNVVVSVAIPSIILAISCIILYELWIKTGRDDARSEKDYTDLLAEYQKSSNNLNEEVMQEFIEAEKQRRYNVEYNKLTHEIDRIAKIIAMLEGLDKRNKLEDIRLSINKRRLVKLTKARECIVIDMPYTYSEQFDQLRYAADESKLKEYKPSDTAVYLSRRRANKYTTILTTTLIGLNIVSPAIGGQNWFIALFMTLLSAIALISSLISGFSTGYNSIAVSSTGVYKTALNFISKAEAYCTKYKKQLRYGEVEEISDIPEEMNKVEEIEQPQVEEVKAEESQISMDIFDNLLK
jgi:hypothetical protein